MPLQSLTHTIPNKNEDLLPFQIIFISKFQNVFLQKNKK